MALALICDRCHGTARIAGVRCGACVGGGAAAQWGDTVLVWSLPIDRSAARGRRVASYVRAALTLVFFLAAGAGIAWYFFAGSDGFVSGRL
ncbi:MAG: hypothetical protein Q8R16_01200, partial [bacterium]|nr:hypothetical protein [bacterium]